MATPKIHRPELLHQCPACGNNFSTKSTTKRFCDVSCRWAYWNRVNPRVYVPETKDDGTKKG